MRIALLGLGLIGGSIARAIAAAREAAGPPVEAWTVVAWTPDGRAPAAALAAGVIDAAADSIGDTLSGADLVVLTAPPLACLDLLEAVAALRGVLPPAAVVTDVASTKAAIVERAAGLGLPFVGGHPMAGVTDRGFDASDGALFDDRPWVICEGPTSPEGGFEQVAALARACGARPVAMSAAEHDRAVASVSHLPLVVAAALVETVVARTDAIAADGSAGRAPADWPAARALAAGGWASSTRLARGDVAMATGIAITNGGVLAERIGELEETLASWRRVIEAGDVEGVSARFEDARRRLLDDETG
ncbi:MAG: prephenate dehydrogenase [Candidatus Limnocylindrales bacterium]